MFAIIQSGGRQYRIAEGDWVAVDRLPGAVGDTVELSEVLLLAGDKEVKIGTPTIPDARIVARIVEERRGPKIVVFRSSRRKGFKKKKGHRQNYTILEIEKIGVNSK